MQKNSNTKDKATRTMKTNEPSNSTKGANTKITKNAANIKIL